MYWDVPKPVGFLQHMTNLAFTSPILFLLTLNNANNNNIMIPGVIRNDEGMRREERAASMIARETTC